LSKAFSISPELSKGRKTYRMQSTRLGEVVRSAAKAMEYPLSQLGFTLTISSDDTEPTLFADADALEQAILNLLGNAVKYSGGARRIEMRMGSASQEAFVDVVDHGIGIPREEQSRIFEKFHRVQSTDTEGIAGTGLGLALALHVVEAHNGRIDVEELSGAWQHIFRSYSFAGTNMTKILVVEDDPGILRTVSDNLKFEKYDIATAMDGETAYKLQQSQRSDLIVLDLMLPRMGGLELCRRLRTEGDQVPILILTARSEEADRVLGLDLGADDYLTKPFSVPELMARIRALLRRTSSASELPALLRFGQVEVDFKKYVARRRGKSIEMTRKEFDLLRFLASREDTVITRDELLNKVWGLDSYPVTRTVDNHVASLRAKLEADPARPIYIQTVHGVGYKFVLQPE
jgi:DNA-binding response OmpR family regulator